MGFFDFLKRTEEPLEQTLESAGRRAKTFISDTGEKLEDLGSRAETSYYKTKSRFGSPIEQFEADTKLQEKTSGRILDTISKMDDEEVIEFARASAMRTGNIEALDLYLKNSSDDASAARSWLRQSAESDKLDTLQKKQKMAIELENQKSKKYEDSTTSIRKGLKTTERVTTSGVRNLGSLISIKGGMKRLNSPLYRGDVETQRKLITPKLTSLKEAGSLHGHSGKMDLSNLRKPPSFGGNLKRPTNPFSGSPIVAQSKSKVKMPIMEVSKGTPWNGSVMFFDNDLQKLVKGENVTLHQGPQGFIFKGFSKGSPLELSFNIGKVKPSMNKKYKQVRE